MPPYLVNNMQAVIYMMNTCGEIVGYLYVDAR